jgi:hypothetical protein
MAVVSGEMLESFVTSFIDFPKPLIGKLPCHTCAQLCYPHFAR